MAAALTILAVLMAVLGIRQYIQTVYAGPSLSFDFLEGSRDNLTYLIFRVSNAPIRDGWLYQLRIKRQPVEVLSINFGVKRFTTLALIFNPVPSLINSGHSHEITLKAGTHAEFYLVAADNQSGIVRELGTTNQEVLTPGEYIVDVHIKADEIRDFNGGPFPRERRFIVQKTTPYVRLVNPIAQ